MPNRKYIKAANAERAIVEEWKKMGYRCMRSAGSHGEIDVLCLKANTLFDVYAGGKEIGGTEAVAIQHKQHGALLTSKDREELFQYIRDTNARVLLATPNPRKKPKPFHYEELKLEDE